MRSYFPVNLLFATFFVSVVRPRFRITVRPSCTHDGVDHHQLDIYELSGAQFWANLRFTRSGHVQGISFEN